jgi:hypothetical protein
MGQILGNKKPSFSAGFLHLEVPKTLPKFTSKNFSFKTAKCLILKALDGAPRETRTPTPFENGF